MKVKKDWESYCTLAYTILKSAIKYWGNPSFYRPITRVFYITVFDCGMPNPTGLISENALNNKLAKKKTVSDHYLSPQFICRMIMDNSNVYLQDYDKFKDLFWLATQTIVVTQQENDNLAALTENDGLNYNVKVPTDKKYNHLGIKLYKRPDGTNRWANSVPVDGYKLEVPEELLDYEKQFLVDQS